MLPDLELAAPEKKEVVISPSVGKTQQVRLQYHTRWFDVLRCLPRLPIFRLLEENFQHYRDLLYQQRSMHLITCGCVTSNLDFRGFHCGGAFSRLVKLLLDFVTNPRFPPWVPTDVINIVHGSIPSPLPHGLLARHIERAAIRYALK